VQRCAIHLVLSACSVFIGGCSGSELCEVLAPLRPQVEPVLAKLGEIRTHAMPLLP